MTGDAQSSGGVCRDDLDECWCCGGLHDGLGLLCPDCDEAGCQYFDGECQSEHKPVLPDGGEPEYTPRRHLEGTLTQLENREKAVRTILGANQKADRNTIHYLQGYYDALQLVTDEVRQAKDAEIMGITPGDSDE